MYPCTECSQAAACVRTQHHCSQSPPGWHISFGLAPLHESVSRSRQLVKTFLFGLFPEVVVEDLCLLTSEAVTNSIKAVMKFAKEGNPETEVFIRFSLHYHSNPSRLVLDCRDNNGVRAMWIPQNGMRRKTTGQIEKSVDVHDTAGLGLSLMQEIVQAARGRLRIRRSNDWNILRATIPVVSPRSPYCPCCVCALPRARVA